MHKSSGHSDIGCVGNEDAPTVISCAHFWTSGVCGHLHHRLFLYSAALCPDGKEYKMKIRVLYEDNIKNGHPFYTTIEIPDGDYSVMLDTDYEQRLTEAKPEKRGEVKRCETVQEVFDLMNKREYNNWRQHNRHWDANAVPSRIDGKRGKAVRMEEQPEPGDEGSKIPNYVDAFPDFTDEEHREHQYDYENCCNRIRGAMKPDYAEMIIAIHLDGLKPGEYAESIGEKLNTLNHRLQRAEKKFKELFPKTSFSSLSHGYKAEGQPSNQN